MGNSSSNDFFKFHIGFSIGESPLEDDINKSIDQMLDVFLSENIKEKRSSQSISKSSSDDIIKNKRNQSINAPSSEDIIKNQINQTMINSSDIIKNNKKLQIIEYYLFHRKIECFFNFGYIPFCLEKNNYFEELYIVNKDWINYWKNYSNYNIAKSYFDKLNSNIENLKEEIENMCDNMINTEEINSHGVSPSSMDNEKAGNHFCSKLILKLEDLDYFISKKNYELFKSCFGCKTEAIKIRAIINNNIIILIFNNQLKIKFIYFGETNLVQLTAYFGPNKFHNIEYRKNLKNKFNNFIYQYILNNNYKNILAFFKSEAMEYIAEKKIKNQFEELIYTLINDNLFLKYLLNNK